MSIYKFKLPDIGEGIAEAEIVAWHVKVGDVIGEDQQLADIMTDKATVEMESPVAGTVTKLAGEVGDQIAIGSVLVEIETEQRSDAGGIASSGGSAGTASDEIALADGAVKPTGAMERANPTLDEEAAPKPPLPRSGGDERGGPVQKAATSKGISPAPPASERGVLASPAVRQRARDLGIDLAEVKTTSDRVRHADLDAYLLYHGGGVRHGASPMRADETIKVVGLRRKIAENMQEAKRRIPHFTLVEEYDVTDLEDTRAMMNADRGDNPKLTLLPFLIAAMGKAITDWPMLNATFDDDAMQLTRHGAMHLGMATQTPGGLMVPVIRDAQSKSVWQLAREIGRLAEAARSGKASRDELMGSTITLSSLGPMGGVTSTPVINRPEVAIIAVNKVREMPVIVDDELEARKLMNLSLSCDHRVVDGWDAANFLQAMKALIENPLRLLSA
ncbi:MAG: 2-oxo acid dehydrogenase subunit E2 [Sphingomonas sp.]|uniref:dihydrolipoamide acetyltransferase family protein n=1 Tax=Sphingomonas sp. TaxID=28214 RepID=UPI0017B8E5A1|nr:dihydrolipoamide acetyltransferase family protein [Sphingomonas sp.]MBA3667990.1 2-oxo acid dehydrogenase subunit E2 [Sphingomonas sp.]